jgi:hypothetical protein
MERPKKLSEITYYINEHERHLGYPPTSIAVRPEELLQIKREVAASDNYLFSISQTPYSSRFRIFGIIIIADPELHG